MHTLPRRLLGPLTVPMGMAKGSARERARGGDPGAIVAARVARATSAILLVSVVEMVVGFAFIPIVVRALGPSGYGDYASLMAIAGIAQVLTNVGLFSAVRKSMTEVEGKELATVASGGLLLSGLLGLIASGVGVVVFVLPQLPIVIDHLRLPIALVAL